MNNSGPTELSSGHYSYSPREEFRRDKLLGEQSPLFDGIDFDSLPPILRTLLVSDGTVTKFLEAYYWEPIELEILFEGDLILSEDLPHLHLKEGVCVLHRKVRMRGVFSGRVFGCAQSYLSLHQFWPGVRDDLVKGRLGVGELLRDHRIETYREILRYQAGSVGDLAADLDAHADEVMISRTYRIQMGGQPAILITDSYPVSRFR